MSRRVRFEKRFNGYPELTLGSYACGVVAKMINGAAQVNLRRPPLLERDMELIAGKDGHVELHDGDKVIADGGPVTLDLETPEPITVTEARQASEGYPFYEEHPSPTCFVCGISRDDGDGLRIFPGPVADRGMVAACWTPNRSLANSEGHVPSEIVWAALDCPSYFSLFPAGGVESVLVQMTADLREPVAAGQPYVISAWKVAEEGRKAEVGVAIFSEDSRLCVLGHSLWVEMEPGQHKRPDL
ncbi:hypothetical protein ACFL9T_10020 [Thermodesulfobacteriota bacterium]